MKRKITKDYKESLLEQLKDSKEAAAYLDAALEEDDEVFLLALRDVAEAVGGVSVVAKQTKLNRESLYRMLSKNGNPELKSLRLILEKIGLRLSVAPAH